MTGHHRTNDHRSLPAPRTHAPPCAHHPTRRACRPSRVAARRLGTALGHLRRVRRASTPDRKPARLRDWTLGIQRRRGVGVAQVALARRLARILYALWRDSAGFWACLLALPGRGGAGKSAASEEIL